MSRSGYSEDLGNWDLIRWRGAVKSAIRGKRGQAMLRELLAALDAMPVKELIAENLVDADGCYCTLGALGAARGMDLSRIEELVRAMPHPEDCWHRGMLLAEIARAKAAA